jgi:uncharacterized Zn finger protein
MTDREIKALQIAAKSKLTRKGNLWLVPSQTGQGEYQVNVDPEFFNCTCPDHDFTQARCKHIFAVEYVIEREQTAWSDRCDRDGESYTQDLHSKLARVQCGSNAREVTATGFALRTVQKPS